MKHLSGTLPIQVQFLAFCLVPRTHQALFLSTELEIIPEQEPKKYGFEISLSTYKSCNIGQQPLYSSYTSFLNLPILLHFRAEELVKLLPCTWPAQVQSPHSYMVLLSTTRSDS